MSSEYIRVSNGLISSIHEQYENLEAKWNSLIPFYTLFEHTVENGKNLIRKERLNNLLESSGIVSDSLLEGDVHIDQERIARLVTILNNVLNNRHPKSKEELYEYISKEYIAEVYKGNLTLANKKAIVKKLNKDKYQLYFKQIFNNQLLHLEDDWHLINTIQLALPEYMQSDTNDIPDVCISLDNLPGINSKYGKIYSLLRTRKIYTKEEMRKTIIRLNFNSFRKNMFNSSQIMKHYEQVDLDRLNIEILFGNNNDVYSALRETLNEDSFILFFNSTYNTVYELSHRGKSIDNYNRNINSYVHTLLSHDQTRTDKRIITRFHNTVNESLRLELDNIALCDLVDNSTKDNIERLTSNGVTSLNLLLLYISSSVLGSKVSSTSSSTSNRSRIYLSKEFLNNVSVLVYRLSLRKDDLLNTSIPLKEGIEEYYEQCKRLQNQKEKLRAINTVLNDATNYFKKDTYIGKTTLISQTEIRSPFVLNGIKAINENYIRNGSTTPIKAFDILKEEYIAAYDPNANRRQVHIQDIDRFSNDIQILEMRYILEIMNRYGIEVSLEKYEYLRSLFHNSFSNGDSSLYKEKLDEVLEDCRKSMYMNIGKKFIFNFIIESDLTSLKDIDKKEILKEYLRNLPDDSHIRDGYDFNMVIEELVRTKAVNRKSVEKYLDKFNTSTLYRRIVMLDSIIINKIKHDAKLTRNEVIQALALMRPILKRNVDIWDADVQSLYYVDAGLVGIVPNGRLILFENGSLHATVPSQRADKYPSSRVSRIALEKVYELIKEYFNSFVIEPSKVAIRKVKKIEVKFSCSRYLGCIPNRPSVLEDDSPRERNRRNRYSSRAGRNGFEEVFENARRSDRGRSRNRSSRSSEGRSISPMIG